MWLDLGGQQRIPERSVGVVVELYVSATHYVFDRHRLVAADDLDEVVGTNNSAPLRSSNSRSRTRS